MRAHARVLPLESLRAARASGRSTIPCRNSNLFVRYRYDFRRTGVQDARSTPPRSGASASRLRVTRHVVDRRAVDGRGVRPVRGVQRAASSGRVISSKLVNPDNRLRPWRAARGGSERRVWRLERRGLNPRARTDRSSLTHCRSGDCRLSNAVTDHTGTPGHTATDVSTLLSPPTPRHTGFDTAYCKTHS